MSIKTIADPLPPYALESDRLQKVLSTAERAQADIVTEVRRVMEHVATRSVQEALRSVSRKASRKPRNSILLAEMIVADFNHCLSGGIL